MTVRALTTLALAALAFATPATAQVPVPPVLPVMGNDPGNGDTRYCGWARDITTRVGDTQTTEYEFAVRKGCGPFVYHHEVFHLIDAQNAIGDWTRQRVASLLGDTYWSDYAPDMDNPAADPPTNELAADAFGTCAMHATGRRKYGTYSAGRRRVVVMAGAYNYRVTWAVHRQVCMTLWDAAGMAWNVPKPRPVWSIPQPDPAPGTLTVVRK